jgi:hypothetical protein
MASCEYIISKLLNSEYAQIIKHLLSFSSFFFFLKVFKTYRIHKSNKFPKIPSPGTLRVSRTAAHSLWTFPPYVPCHSAWKPAHHPGCQL